MNDNGDADGDEDATTTSTSTTSSSSSCDREGANLGGGGGQHSAHCAANCLRHARSRDQSAIVNKSCAIQYIGCISRATCVPMPHGTKGSSAIHIDRAEIAFILRFISLYTHYE